MVSNMSIFFMGVSLGLSILFPVFLASWESMVCAAAALIFILKAGDFPWGSSSGEKANHA